MVNYDKLHERLRSVLPKSTNILNNPTNEDRMATEKLCRIIERYIELLTTNYQINCYFKVDELITMRCVYDPLKISVISKDDAQEMIDAFKDMIDYYINAQ